MTSLDLHLLEHGMHADGEGCWPDLIAEGYTRAELSGIAGLPDGTSEGRPVVTLRIKMPDGKVVLAQTTLRLFLTAADALRAKYGHP